VAQFLLHTEQHIHYWNQLKLHPTKALIESGPRLCWRAWLAWLHGDFHTSAIDRASEHIAVLRAIRDPLSAALGRHSHLMGKLARLLEAWNSAAQDWEEEVEVDPNTPRPSSRALELALSDVVQHMHTVLLNQVSDRQVSISGSAKTSPGRKRPFSLQVQPPRHPLGLKAGRRARSLVSSQSVAEVEPFLAEELVVKLRTCMGALATFRGSAGKESPRLISQKLVKNALWNHWEGVKPHMKPSHLSRNWLWYGIWGTVFTTTIGVLVKNSKFCGSGNLDSWCRDIHDKGSLFIEEHCMEPIQQMYREIFLGHYKSVTDPADVEASRNALQNMLFAFGMDEANATLPSGNKASVAALLRARANECDMSIVMGAYENALHSSSEMAWQAIRGELPRMLLIQVQKLKMDVEMEMLGIEQLMRFVPSILHCVYVIYLCPFT